MAVEAVATGLGGIGGAGPKPGAGPQDSVGLARPSGFEPGAGQPSSAQHAPPAREVAFEPTLERSGGPAETALRATQPEVRAAPQRTGDSIGHNVLDGVNKLQKGDAAWRNGSGSSPSSANEPTLKVAAREPGPASAQIRGNAAHGVEVAGHPTSQPGKSANPSFDGMVHQLEQVSGQVIQVSIVSKTTSSFTGSLNKLLSSS